MARHRNSPKRAGIVARSRRPALLGGAFGGGVALAIGITACVAFSSTSAGVHFTFVDRAEAAVVGSRNYEPAVTRDLATAPSATPSATPTPSATAAAKRAAAQTTAKAAAEQSAAAQVSGATATPTPVTAPAPAAAPAAAAAPVATAAPAAAASSSPSAAPSQAATSAPSPSQSPAPVVPDPQRTSGGGTSGDGCVLVILCF